MAATDPKSIIRNIIRNYIILNPITKDNGINSASVLHIYERGPEDWKYLFLEEGFDVIISYGEPRVRSARELRDIPVHYLSMYPVTVQTITKYNPALGTIESTSTTLQAKTRTAVRAAVEASAQSGTPAYTLTVTDEVGRNWWRAGLNVWETIYSLEYMTG